MNDEEKIDLEELKRASRYAAESMDDFLCEAKEQLSFVQIEGLGIEHLSHLEKASAMLRETLK